MKAPYWPSCGFLLTGLKSWASLTSRQITSASRCFTEKRWGKVHDRQIHTYRSTKFIERTFSSGSQWEESWGWSHVCPRGWYRYKQLSMTSSSVTWAMDTRYGEDKKLGGMFYTPENHAAIWRDLSRLKAQADRKLLKFNL